MSAPARVLVVDDSPTMRGLITAVLSSDPEVNVIGQAGDALEAREAIKKLNPDVVTLDIEMPNMDGFGSDFGFDSTEDLLSLGDDDGNFNRRVKEGPERKLARMVEINEERAAKILRKWAIDEAA